MSEYTYEYLSKQEKELVFDSFSRDDAATLGNILNEESKKTGFAVSFEIVLNGLVVYRYFQDGCPPASDNWLRLKRAVVESQGIGSLRFGKAMDKSGQTLEDNKLDPMKCAACGGGMPINLRNTGMIGFVCVSGCPDHLVDQQIVLNSLRRMIGYKLNNI